LLPLGDSGSGKQAGEVALVAGERQPNVEDIVG
jgi:hypothetical protein